MAKKMFRSKDLMVTKPSFVETELKTSECTCVRPSKEKTTFWGSWKELIFTSGTTSKGYFLLFSSACGNASIDGFRDGEKQTCNCHKVILPLGLFYFCLQIIWNWGSKLGKFSKTFQNTRRNNSFSGKDGTLVKTRNLKTGPGPSERESIVAMQLKTLRDVFGAQLSTWTNRFSLFIVLF